MQLLQIVHYPTLKQTSYINYFSVLSKPYSIIQNTYKILKQRKKFPSLTEVTTGVFPLWKNGNHDFYLGENIFTLWKLDLISTDPTEGFKW